MGEDDRVHGFRSRFPQHSFKPPELIVIDAVDLALPEFFTEIGNDAAQQDKPPCSHIGKPVERAESLFPLVEFTLALIEGVGNLVIADERYGPVFQCAEKGFLEIELTNILIPRRLERVARVDDIAAMDGDAGLYMIERFDQIAHPFFGFAGQLFVPVFEMVRPVVMVGDHGKREKRVPRDEIGRIDEIPAALFRERPGVG